MVTIMPLLILLNITMNTSITELSGLEKNR